MGYCKFLPSIFPANDATSFNIFQAVLFSYIQKFLCKLFRNFHNFKCCRWFLEAEKRHLSHSILIFACFSFVVLLQKRWSIVLSLRSFLSSFFLENDGDDVECEVGPGFALLLSLFVFPFTPLAGLETSGSPPFLFFVSSV